jgi:hypothetical protein
MQWTFMYSLALIIFVVSEKAFEHFSIGSNVNLCIAVVPSSQKLQIWLKPNCTWMFIWWSSTILRFFGPIWNGFSQFISFREEDLWNFSQSEHIIGPGSHVEYSIGTKNIKFVEDHPKNIMTIWENTEIFSSLKLFNLHWLNINCASIQGSTLTFWPTCPIGQVPYWFYLPFSVYDKEHLYLNFLTKIFQKSSSITCIYKTVIFPQIDRYVYSISQTQHDLYLRKGNS